MLLDSNAINPNPDEARQCTFPNEVFKNILFYQNEYPVAEQCMAWGWTVAVEVQFYLIAPIVVLVGRLISKGVGGSLLGFGVLSILFLVPRMSIPYDYSPKLTSLQLLESTAHNSADDYFSRMYASSETRIFSCFMGGFAGCCLSWCRENLKGDERVLLKVNTVSTVLFFVIVFLVFSDYATTFNIDENDNLFLIYFRPIFSLLLSMFMLALGVSRHLENCLSSEIAVGIVVSEGTEGSKTLVSMSEDTNLMVCLNFLTTLPKKILTPSWYKINSHTAHLISYDSFLLHPLLINGLYLVFLGDLKPLGEIDRR